MPPALPNPGLVAQLAQAVAQIRAIQDRVTQLERNQRTSQAGFTTIENSSIAVNDSNGNPALVMGLQQDGTYAITSAVNTAPVAPSTPVLTAGALSVWVTWDGMMGDGSSPLSDFAFVQIHLSAQANFTPGPATLQGSLARAGMFAVGNLVAGTTYYVALVGVNQAGVTGPASVEASVAASSIPANIPPGSLTAPMFAAGLIIAGIVDATTINFASLIGQDVIVNPSGVFVYSDTPASGNLVISLASAAGTDAFGNVFPAGLNVVQGAITGIGVDSAQIMAPAITGGSMTGTAIGGGSLQGATVTECEIVFDTIDGNLVCYATATNTITQTVAGNYSFTPPAGTGQAYVECWGAGAGANYGSSSAGQPGGGGGAYSAEPNYALDPTGATTYLYTVGAGGPGAFTGNTDGQDGGDSFFDTNGAGVYAFGGDAPRSSSAGGLGGTDSTNSIAHAGGNGGAFTGGSAGAGGGGSAWPTGGSAGGSPNSGSTAGAGGTSGTGGGSGGNGGASGASGSNGAAPGGGGGGSGQSTTSSPFSKTYSASSSVSYYGTDIGGSKRNTNGSGYQGTASGDSGVTGNQFSFWELPSGITSDLSGVTISSVTVTVTNQHSWYNSGMTVVFGWSNRTTFPSSISSLASGDKNNQAQGGIAEGGTHSYGILSMGAALASGAARALMLGPSPSESNLSYYGYFKGGSGSVTVKVTGTSGSGSQPHGGNGTDGKVKITYQSSTALVLAISPVSDTDDNGNAFGIGLTGMVSAFQPGTSPTVVETWHTASNSTGITGTLQYKLNADNTVSLRGEIITNATTAANATAFTLPTGYRPTTTFAFCTPNNFSGYTPLARTISINSSGVVSISPSGVSTNFVLLDGIRFPLD